VSDLGFCLQFLLIIKISHCEPLCGVVFFVLGKIMRAKDAYRRNNYGKSLSAVRHMDAFYGS
jgi:hypothetical protein